MSRGRAALGFSVHTGWATMVAVSSGPDGSTVVLDRQRLVLMGNDRQRPRFVYHAAQKLDAKAAERLVRESVQESQANAKASLQQAVADIETKRYTVVAGSIIVGSRPAPESLESILRSHSLIHAAEGELFRSAIRSAGKALRIPVIEVRSKELAARAAAILGIPAEEVDDHLAAIGRAAGRPWAKDHKDACLAASIALRE
jgi:hypothetical protein